MAIRLATAAVYGARLTKTWPPGAIFGSNLIVMSCSRLYQPCICCKMVLPIHLKLEDSQIRNICISIAKSTGLICDGIILAIFFARPDDSRLSTRLDLGGLVARAICVLFA